MIAFFLAVLFAVAPVKYGALDTPGGPVGMTHLAPSLPDKHH
jgi:hypothetical protein